MDRDAYDPTNDQTGLLLLGKRTVRKDFSNVPVNDNFMKYLSSGNRESPCLFPDESMPDEAELRGAI
jgi:hypothetical protein